MAIDHDVEILLEALEQRIAALEQKPVSLPQTIVFEDEDGKQITWVQQP